MPLYADVALPVPLDRAFTYALGDFTPEIGARVLVPFSGQRLLGVVVALHDNPPSPDVDLKKVERLLDDAALLSPELLELARWIAQYYCAPLGEVLRGMLPLTAEVRRHWVYRIAEQGRNVLYESSVKGSSRRSKLSREDQNREYAVLNYLEPGESARLAAIRSATGANKAMLDAMVKKRWLFREPLTEQRDARRLETVAVLADERTENGERRTLDPRRLPKLNDNQLAVMAELAGCGGRELVRELRTRLSRRGVPDSTLNTLVRRGLIRLEEAAQAFHITSLATTGKRFAHEHTLNESQIEALASIAAAMQRNTFAPHLLYGVTGSGKTAVYVAAMQRALSNNKSALLLVPEIGLTPATAAQMVAAFGSEVALLHSQLTPDERAEQWHRIRRGEARVVVGTRSAVFAPMPHLGLILVDEEHDGSYKQEETPRYHARDVAVMRAKLLGITIVLGSATPSLESWNNAERGRYARIEMLERVQSRPLPVVEMIDMRSEFRETGQEQLFARQLLEETQSTLDRNEQVIILLNRRGYSFVVMCRACGEKIECENCAISLTYHKHANSEAESDLGGRAPVGARLECHYCGFRRGVPSHCPKCNSEHLFFLGAGSQQGEERLQELFPNARIGRMDRDTVRTRGDMERLLQRLHSGEINLLVGTQMIAKGHDIHGVTLVGVVGADFALGLPDFRAAERVFQLLTQVSGRAGRGDKPGRVLVQTYQPDHYVNKFAREHDYTGFAAREMYFRRAMRYPPFAALANVLIQSEQLEEVLAISTQLRRWLAANRPESVRILGPAPAPIPRIKRIYRYHLLLKSDRRDALSALLRSMLAQIEAAATPRRNVTIDVDALHLM
ncbi:MAG TPA: primosomal protein N' [Bryocella sp.]|nr:primosomal protein N' [Bryocella sp.]